MQNFLSSILPSSTRSSSGTPTAPTPPPAAFSATPSTILQHSSERASSTAALITTPPTTVIDPPAATSTPWELLPLTTKQVSACWKYFRKFKKTPTIPSKYCACMLCLASEKKKSSEVRLESLERYEDSSTSKLFRHLKTYHRDVFDTDMQQAADTNTGTMDSFVAYENKLEQKALVWMIDTVQPLSCFDQVCFREMIQAAVQYGKTGNADKAKLSSESMTNKLHKQSAACRTALKTAMMEEQVTISFDGWTSEATETYMGVTAHFITHDWELQ